MSVDLSRVNVSNQQFQEISSGDFNAGEVKLESETRLGKINNHVHQEWRNAKSLSHEEVLAVKNAFVKALSDSGVGAEEIAAVRRELGLGADAGIDKSLRERSLRPLTRQQVRAILDRNAATINGAVRPGTIRTTDELNAGGNQAGNEMTFRLSRDGQGGVKIAFETTLRPTHLIVDGEPVPLGAGSELKGRYALTLSAEKMNALGELDFAACDHTAADQVLNANPPQEQKMGAAVNRLPPAFRLDLEPTTSFSVVLN